MKGKKRKILTAGWILERISEWQVYNLYLPGIVIGKKRRSPFRADRIPSFRVVARDGRLYHTDYGDMRWRGNCFDFVMQLFGISYKEALEKIVKDIGLMEKGVTVEWQQPEIIEKPAIIQMSAWKQWQPEHISYLKQHNLSISDLDLCSDTTVYPVKKWALNREVMPLSEGEPCFAFHLENERGNWLKIYRPTREKDSRWISNIPITEVMGLSCLEKCKTLIISKSVKDALVIKKFTGLHVVVCQSENVVCFSDENIAVINSLCDNVYVSFDSDKPGKKASIELTKFTGWKHINVPDKWLSANIKDWADLVRDFGYKPLVSHFKKNKLI